MACLFCGSTALEPLYEGIRDLLKPGGWAVVGGALLMLPSLALAALERRSGRSGATAGTMFFCGRKLGGAHVP